MKKLIVILACALTAAASYAQGTVNFTTRVPGVVDLRVAGLDGQFLSGSGYTAQLWGGPAGATQDALQPLTPTTTFRTGAAAGYVLPTSTAVSVPGVPGGQSATLQLRVWNNQGGTLSTWEAASGSPNGEIGMSQLYTVGPLANPNNNPPDIPVDPIGFGTAGAFQTFIVPEPTTIALGILGAAALLLRRRK